MRQIRKLQKGWKARTACSVTAHILRSALSLKCPSSEFSFAMAMAEIDGFVQSSDDDDFLFVQVWIAGKEMPGAQPVPGNCNVGHNFLLVIRSGTAQVLQSYVGNCGFEGYTMPQARPGKIRPVSVVRQVLQDLERVYATGDIVDTEPRPETWELYRASLVKILGMKIPDDHMRTGVMGPCRLSAERKTRRQVLDSLLHFSRAPDAHEAATKWIQGARESRALLSSSEFLSSLPIYNVQGKLDRFRADLNRVHAESAAAPPESPSPTRRRRLVRRNHDERDGGRAPSKVTPRTTTRRRPARRPSRTPR